MNVEIFTLCEAATNKNGQISLLATFNDLFSEADITMVGFTVVVQVRFTRAEEGIHTVKMQMMDNDGAEKWVFEERRVQTYFASAKQETCALKLISHGAAELAVGAYELRLFVDGAERSSTPLGIVRVT